MVPRRIFQTWKTHDVPPRWKDAQQSVRTNNPNWQYTLLSEDDATRIVRENFPDFLPTFLRFNYDIQRADAIRYLVMYLYGGIYLDLDYVALKAFDGIALPPGKEVGLLRSNNAKGQVTNSFLLSQPNATFWLQCLEAMKQPRRWWAVTKHLEVFDTTGPFMINRIFAANERIAHVLEGISVPCDVCEVDACRPDSNYFIMPIKGDSWHAWDSRMINWVYCNASALRVLALALALVAGAFVLSCRARPRCPAEGTR
jgi:mannosyltransferase OCH1-like enzyme